jgi:hypothetical protein
VPAVGVVDMAREGEEVPLWRLVAGIEMKGALINRWPDDFEKRKEKKTICEDKSSKLVTEI